MYKILMILVILLSSSFSQVVTRTIKEAHVARLSIEHTSYNNSSESITISFRNARYAYIVDIGLISIRSQEELDYFIQALKGVKANINDPSSDISFNICDGALIRTNGRTVYIYDEDDAYQMLWGSRVDRVIAALETFKFRK